MKSYNSEENKLLTGRLSAWKLAAGKEKKKMCSLQYFKFIDYSSSLEIGPIIGPVILSQCLAGYVFHIASESESKYLNSTANSCGVCTHLIIFARSDS